MVGVQFLVLVDLGEEHIRENWEFFMLENGHKTDPISDLGGSEVVEILSENASKVRGCYNTLRVEIELA